MFPIVQIAFQYTVVVPPEELSSSVPSSRYIQIYRRLSTLVFLISNVLISKYLQHVICSIGRSSCVIEVS